MQQVAICPDCNAPLALPAAGVEIDGSLAARCPSCASEFPLTINRLSTLPVLELRPASVETPAPIEPPTSVEAPAPVAPFPTTPPSSFGAGIAPLPAAEPKPAEVLAPTTPASSLAPLLSPAPEQPPADTGSATEAPTLEGLPTLADLLERRQALDDSSADEFTAPIDTAPTDTTPAEQPAVAEQSLTVEAAIEAAAEPTIGEPLTHDFSFDLGGVAAQESSSPSPTDSTLLASSDDAANDYRFGAASQAMVVTAGGFLGLVVGYYLLLVAGGPSRDAMNVASFLPQSVLPASFSTEVSSLAPDESAPEESTLEESTLEESSGGSLNELPTEPEQIASTLPAEASPITPIEEISPLTPTEPQAEPTTIPASYNTPIGQSAQPVALWARTDLPRYGVDRLAAALEGADEAVKVLQEGRLDRPSDLKPIGLAFAELCELAQVVSLLDADSSHPDMMINRLEAEDVYRSLFRSEHIRSTSRKVASRWIAWPGRPHGGVFFSGVPTPPKPVGDGLYGYDFKFEDGSITTVVSPQMLKLRRFRRAEEMLVIGSVIDSPREKIQGYEGDADRIVWRATSIALKLPDRD